MTFVSGSMPPLYDGVKKKITAGMEPRVKGSGSTRYHLANVRKQTLPKKKAKRG